MRVLLIEPGVYEGDALVRMKTRPTQLVSLTLPYLAALAPSDVDVQLAYEITEDLEHDYDLSSYDVIGITAQTSQVKRALELMQMLRGTGPKIIVGGPATVEDDHRLVRVLSRFADAVAVGDAELTWPEILSDAQTGQLRKTYQASTPSPIGGRPMPRFELMNFAHIDSPHVLPVITSAGCPRRCSFCSEFLYGEWLLRPIEDVVAEIFRCRDEFGISRVCFRDDNFLAHPDRSKELLSRLIGQGFEWACQTDLSLARHPDLLEVALASGMRIASFGIESVRQANREWTEKTFFRMADAEDLLLRLHAEGVETQANIIFGFDNDDPEIFEETLQFLTRTKVSRFFPSILYPIPGTRLHQQLRSENRLLSDSAPGVGDPLLVWFEPKNMTRAQLVDGYLWTKRRFDELPDGDRGYWLGRDVMVI